MMASGDSFNLSATCISKDLALQPSVFRSSEQSLVVVFERLQIVDFLIEITDEPSLTNLSCWNTSR